jgi:negative regulator of flagellin synthesis FlgM
MFVRINHIGSMGVNPYKRYVDKGAQTNKLTSKQDQVEISEAAKELQQGSQWAIERQQKVRALKEQVQNGTYKIDADAIAKSIYEFYFKN